MYGIKAKNNLLFCDMDTVKARKAITEKVQVYATVNSLQAIGIQQGAMCWTEIYETLVQEFANYVKIGVVSNYSLIGCVINCVQPQ